MNGISICVLTYNVLFYNKLQLKQVRELTRLMPYELIFYDNGSTDGSVEYLESQEDVRLIKGTNNSLRHGEALDVLAKESKYPITCTLDSDAFPMSPDWLTPAFFLDDDCVLAGIDRGWGRQFHHYVCPSYLFGWTDWIKKHTFADTWPTADTGELMGKACVEEGKHQKLWKYSCTDWGDKFKSNKPNNYNGWVWHTWWGGRSKSIPGLAGDEFEVDYHDYVENMLRRKFNLDF